MGLHEQHTQDAEFWSFLLGVGVFTSPFIFDFAQGTMLANSLIVGALVCTIATVRGAVPAKASWLSWTNMFAGLWLIMSPYILGYTLTFAAVGTVIVGIMIAGLEYYSAHETQSGINTRSYY